MTDAPPIRDFTAEQIAEDAALGDDREARAFMLAERKLYRAQSLPASVILSLGRITGESNGAEDAHALVDALRDMVEPGQQDEFEAALNGDPIPVLDEAGEATGEVQHVVKPTIKTLFKIVQYLAEAEAGRPFDPSLPSVAPSAVPASGKGLRGGSLQTVVPPSRRTA